MSLGAPSSERPIEDVVRDVIQDKERLERRAATAPTLLESSFKSAAQLIGLQLGTRLLTFALNQALLRLSTPAAFGTVSIQLDLLLHSTLFLAREPVRDAFLRWPSGEAFQQSQTAKNTAWIPVLLGTPLTLVFGALYHSVSAAAVRAQSGFQATVLAYTLSACLELLAEPVFLDVRARLNTQKRVKIEGAAFLLKAILNVALLAYLPETELLWAFAAGQLIHGLTLFLGYWSSSIADLKPRRNTQTGSSQATSFLRHFDLPTLSLTWALFKQSIVKQFLTEGDKLVVSYLSPISNQGAYAVALNYGSLFARILFQPIEESSRVFFGRSAAPALKPSTARSQLNASVELLTTLLHFHLLLGLVLVFFCPPYVRPLLQCVLGDKWMSTPAPALLQTYCYLIPLLGVNGITEAFVQAVASQQELSAVSKWMTVSSVVYAASCCTFCHTLGFGENGLVLANMLSMVVRIFFAFRFTQTWLRQKGHQKGLVWSQVLPPMNVLVAAGLAGHVVRWSVRQYTARATPVALLRHLGVGVLLGLAYVATILMYDQDFIERLGKMVRRRPGHQDETRVETDRKKEQ